MSKLAALPAAAVVGGLVGLIVRRSFLVDAFEPDTGLALSGTPIGIAMWAVVAVTAVVLLLLARRGGHRSYDKCYALALAPYHRAALVLQLAAAFLFLAAGCLCLMSWVSAPIDPMLGRRSVGLTRLFLGVVCLITAAALPLTAQKLRKGQPFPPGWTTVPGFAGCFWVMANYQDWSQDPNVARYVLPLLAIVLSMLAGCLLAGFAFGKGRPATALFLSTACAALCLMVLGDGLPMSDTVVALAMTCYHLSIPIALGDNESHPLPSGCSPSACAACPGCTPPAPSVPRSEQENV